MVGPSRCCTGAEAAAGLATLGGWPAARLFWVSGINLAASFAASTAFHALCFGPVPYQGLLGFGLLLPALWFIFARDHPDTLLYWREGACLSSGRPSAGEVV